jgi:hypothetical protein
MSTKAGAVPWDVPEAVDKAWWAVIMTAHITGTSARKVDETAARTRVAGPRVEGPTEPIHGCH